MEKFDLSVWLKDKSRKVMTREGKDVEIIHTNSPVPHHPIVGFIDKSIYTWTIDGKLIYGKKEQDKNDLFFADEGDKLTEFEKAVKQVMWTAYNYDDCSNGKDVDDISNVKATSKSLLDLARKELIEEFSDDNFAIDFAISKGKQDVLETLPKWKKTVQDDYHQGNIPCTNPTISSDEEYLIVGTYEIKISDLETLPKEE